MRAESGCILAQQVLVDAGNDFSGTVATLDGPLVDVLVQCVLCATEQRAVDDVHIRVVARLAQAVAPELRPEVVRQTVHRVQVGKGPLVALGHGSQLLVEEKEGQRFAVLADEHVGTLHQFGSRDGLQVSDGGQWFVGQFGRLRGRLLQFLVRLFDSFLFEVLQLELTHDLLHDGACERLSASRFAYHEQLHQQGMHFDVVHILGPHAGGQCTIAVDGGEDGRYAELLGRRIPEYAYRLREVGRL